MSVKINIPSYLQPYTEDTEAVEVNGSTVNECLSYLIKQFPHMERMVFAKDGTLLAYVSIYVGDEFAYTGELAKPVKDGEELHILHIIGGG